MSLRTYAEVRPWAKSIAQQVGQRIMPPFHAAGPIGRYVNDLRLSDLEIADVLEWVEHGAERGALGEEIIPPESDDQQWKLGEPDIVIEFPEHEISTDEADSDPYVHVASDYVFDQDLWINGFEWQFSNYRAMHHANVRHAMPIPKSFRVNSNSPAFRFGIMIHAWLPGQAPELLPEDSAIMIPKNTHPYLTAHYAPRSLGEYSSVRLGIHLFDGELKAPRWMISSSIKSRPFNLTPGIESHTETLHAQFPFDAIVYSFNVHMHYRGKSAVINFREPDGKVTPVFEVPKYSFDWQRNYVLKDPFRVPRNTTVDAILEWDNSDANPANPDPNQTVKFGTNSNDEMGGIQVIVAATNPDGTTIKVTNGITEIPTDELPEGFTPQSFFQVQDALKSMSPKRRERLIKEALELKNNEAITQKKAQP
jgi:hypothetical protein